jgi:hypothetical protein
VEETTDHVPEVHLIALYGSDGAKDPESAKGAAARRQMRYETECRNGSGNAAFGWDYETKQEKDGQRWGH